MNDNPGGSAPKGSTPRTTLSEDTHVDLGDDLLNTHTEMVDPEESPLEMISKNADEDEIFKGARILFNEGLLEEAKKMSFKLLRDNPRNILARQLLEEIHQQELHTLFSEREERKPRFKSINNPAWEDPEVVLERLEKDMGQPKILSSLFPDEKSVELYWAGLKKTLSNEHVSDQLDMGIAFLEMGLGEIAEKIFTHVVSVSESQELKTLELKSKCLLVYAQLQLDKNFEAIMVLETVLNQKDILDSDKLEFFYLLARTYEKLSRISHAIETYKLVMLQNRRYRDTEYRLQKLGVHVGR